MVTKYLSYEFINNKDENMIFVIDPPCVEYTIEPGQKFELKIQEINYSENNKGPVLIFRCEDQCTNIDVNYCDSISITTNGVEEKIW